MEHQFPHRPPPFLKATHGNNTCALPLLKLYFLGTFLLQRIDWVQVGVFR